MVNSGYEEPRSYARQDAILGAGYSYYVVRVLASRRVGGWGVGGGHVPSYGTREE